MMLLVGANNTIYREFMCQYPQRFGFFIQPRSYYRNTHMRDDRVRWAMDNDAYNGFDADNFTKALAFLTQYRHRCLFVTCPDVVGNHAATLELWREWQPYIKEMEYPVAFVGQDGCVIDEVPWNDMDALFIGGTDRFKDRQSRQIIAEAKRRKLWVHVGRVNDSRRRLHYCLKVGADSIDGTSYAHKPDKMLKWYLSHMQEWELQRKLL